MERLQRASDVFCADAYFVDRIDRRCGIVLSFLQFSFQAQPAAMHGYHATNRCRESSHTGVSGQRPMEKTTVLQDAKRSPVEVVDFRPLAGQSRIPDRMRCDDISISTRWW